MVLVLQRRGRKKQVYVNGETIELDDSDDDYGNLGITKGTLLVIDCDSDEAIGMAQSSSNNNIPIHIDQSLYQSLQLPITTTNNENNMKKRKKKKHMTFVLVLRNKSFKKKNLVRTNQYTTTPTTIWMTSIIIVTKTAVKQPTIIIMKSNITVIIIMMRTTIFIRLLFV